MKTIECKTDDIIFRQGDLEPTMFHILRGSVGIYTDYGTENENRLAVLGSDQLLGEMGMIENCPRSATAAVLEDGTALLEITEDEFSDYLRDKPEMVLQVLRQLSSRIVETNEKYYSACRILRENEEAERSGSEKPEALSCQMETIREETGNKVGYHIGQTSSFLNYVLEDLDGYKDNYQIVRAGPLERMMTRSIPPENMHPNPDDEFSQVSVGPNDRIINEYVKQIPMIKRMGEDIYPEPVVVYKMLPDGYMILNGHHRWAAALKTGVAKLHAVITNPRS